MAEKLNFTITGGSVYNICISNQGAPLCNIQGLLSEISARTHSWSEPFRFCTLPILIKFKKFRINITGCKIKENHYERKITDPSFSGA